MSRCSISNMISDAPNLVFVMGMDREKVAAGLAVKHEKLLPYLAQTMDNSPAPDKDNAARLRGIRYGYSFIEKFIQVPFVLPQPNEKSITRLLLAMPGQLQKEDAPPPAPDLEPTPDPLEPPVPQPEPDEDKELEAKARAETQEQIEEEFMKFEGDDDNFRAIVLMVSKPFDYNPRRVKQFVNTFRLRAATAKVTGLYEPKDGKRLTFEQLGKFVGIGLRWPLFMRAVERDPVIFAQVVDVAEERPEAQATDNIKQWCQELKLTQLIKAGCSDKTAEGKSEAERARFSLIGADIVRLLEVAPSVTAPMNEEL